MLNVKPSAFQVIAASPQWDLLEVDYVSTEIDDTNLEPDGFSISATKLITDSVFLTGSYGLLSDDISGTDVDVEVEASRGRFSESGDDNGFGVSTGIRVMITDDFELAGQVSYVDIADEDETSFGVKGYYYVTEQLAVSFGYSASSESDSLEIGARLAF